jgi:hypothetical protein
MLEDGVDDAGSRSLEIASVVDATWNSHATAGRVLARQTSSKAQC